jgi:plasmid stabilization system protein ParE
MNYRVAFSLEAAEQLVALYRYIAEMASPEIAARYTDSIVSHCNSLRYSPYRGARRDDVRPGLRVTNYRKRVVIAFDVNEGLVTIIGVFYGGQDYESFFDVGDSEII